MIPQRENSSQMYSKMINDCTKQLIKEIKDINELGLTIGLWTNLAKDNYIICTAHYI